MRTYQRFQKNKFRAFILKHKIKLNFYALSLHPLVDFYFIKSHPEFPWTDNIALNPNVNIDILDYYPEYNWNYQKLSGNPNITIKYILSKIEKNWCWYTISNTLATIVESVDLYPNLPWNWNGISYNNHITESFVLSHRDKIFDEFFLTINPAISINFILKYPEFNWNQDFICRNPNIVPEDLEQLEYIDWNILSETIDVDFMFSSPQFPWGFSSSNQTIRDRHIIEHPEIKWDWSDLAVNPNISPELIRSHSRKFFFTSPNISINEIDRDDLNYEDLMHISVNAFENSIDKLEFAEKIIYFLWIPKCYDPNRESGKRMAQHALKKYAELEFIRDT